MTRGARPNAARLRALLQDASPDTQRRMAEMVRIGAQLVGPDDDEYPGLMVLARQAERGEVTP